MGTIQKMAKELSRGAAERVVGGAQIGLAVGAMIEVRTPNTAKLASVPSLETEWRDVCEQWRRRLLANP